MKIQCRVNKTIKNNNIACSVNFLNYVKPVPYLRCWLAIYIKKKYSIGIRISN